MTNSSQQPEVNSESFEEGLKNTNPGLEPAIGWVSFLVSQDRSMPAMPIANQQPTQELGQKQFNSFNLGTELNNQAKIVNSSFGVVNSQPRSSGLNTNLGVCLNDRVGEFASSYEENLNYEASRGRQSQDWNILGKPPEDSDRESKGQSLSTRVVPIETEVASKVFDKMPTRITEA